MKCKQAIETRRPLSLKSALEPSHHERNSTVPYTELYDSPALGDDGLVKYLCVPLRRKQEEQIRNQSSPVLPRNK